MACCTSYLRIERGTMNTDTRFLSDQRDETSGKRVTQFAEFVDVLPDFGRIIRILRHAPVGRARLVFDVIKSVRCFVPDFADRDNVSQLSIEAAFSHSPPIDLQLEPLTVHHDKPWQHWPHDSGPSPRAKAALAQNIASSSLVTARDCSLDSSPVTSTIFAAAMRQACRTVSCCSRVF